MTTIDQRKGQMITKLVKERDELRDKNAELRARVEAMDDLIEALQMIEDGYKNPRRLARSVLAGLKDIQSPAGVPLDNK